MKKPWLTFVVGVLVGAIVTFVLVGLIPGGSWAGQLLQGTSVGGGGAAGAQPTYAGANVDGNIGEWDLNSDVFSNMYRASNPTKKVESRLYLRYDCNSNTMYALVLSAGSWPVLIQPGENWLAINSIGNKVNFTAFAAVNQTSGNQALGWEASFALSPGSYSLWAHTNVDDGGSQTSGINGIPLTIECYTPTAVDLLSFTVEASGGQTGTTRTTHVLRWQTASEVDNLGFNVYASNNQNGPWMRLNRSMIPSQVSPGSMMGASYEYVYDRAMSGFTYFYLLEAVDITGGKTSYGPVSP